MRLAKAKFPLPRGYPAPDQASPKLRQISSSEIVIKAVKFDDDFKSGAVVFEIDQASKINANFAILSRGKDSYFDLFDLDQNLSNGAVRLLASVLEDSCASAEAFCLHFDGAK